MKAKNFIIMVVLGIVMMLCNTSCVVYSGTVVSEDGTSHPVYSLAQNITKTGAMTVGEYNTPCIIYLQNMKIIRNGITVTVKDGNNKTIKEYNTGLYDQSVRDVFWATSRNGQHVEVTITIQGPNRINWVIIKDGAHTDTFNLRRD